MIKKVFICCADDDLSVKEYIRYALACGTAPVVPLFFSECLEESDVVLSARLALIWSCDEMWIFGTEMTDSMKIAMRFCQNLNIRMQYVSDKKLKEVTHEK